MRWADKDGLRIGRAVGGLVLLGTWCGSMAGCRAGLDGPYACESGYASCVTPNACETNVMTDGLHCGSCDQVCGVGATCVEGQCGHLATQVATLPANSTTAI